MPLQECAGAAHDLQLRDDLLVYLRRSIGEQVFCIEPKILVLLARAEISQNRFETLLHPRIQTVIGHYSSTKHKRPCSTQDAPRLVKQLPPRWLAAQNLHQHHNIEQAIGKRQSSAVRLYEPGRPVSAKIVACSKHTKHTEREVRPDIVISGGDKGPADASASGAEIKDPEWRAGKLNDSAADRLGDLARKRAALIEAGRRRVIASGHRKIPGSPNAPMQDVLRRSQAVCRDPPGTQLARFTA